MEQNAEKNYGGGKSSLKRPTGKPIIPRGGASFVPRETDMDVGSIKPGGIENRGERTVAITRPDVDTPKPHRARDSATISRDSRETLNRVHDLAQEAQRPAADREQVVQAAAARLASGELETPEVYSRVADAILGQE